MSELNIFLSRITFLTKLKHFLKNQLGKYKKFLNHKKYFSVILGKFALITGKIPDGKKNSIISRCFPIFKTKPFISHLSDSKM